MLVQVMFDSGDAILGDPGRVSLAQIRVHLKTESIVVLTRAAILVDDVFVPVREPAAAVYLREAISVRVV